jgi:hypothetical protein
VRRAFQREPAADGFRVSLGTVKRVRRELGLRCVQQQRRFRVQTTDSGHRQPLESFFGTLKTELVHHRRYQTRAEAAHEIAEYIDLFYNRQRRQARLGYLSPAAYTQLFTRQRRAA